MTWTPGSQRGWDPLHAHDLQAMAHRLDRRDEVAVGLEAERGHEPGRAQHPQRVVGEGTLGRLRRPEAPASRYPPRSAPYVTEAMDRASTTTGVSRPAAV